MSDIDNPARVAAPGELASDAPWTSPLASDPWDEERCQVCGSASPSHITADDDGPCREVPPLSDFMLPPPIALPLRAPRYRGDAMTLVAQEWDTLNAILLREYWRECCGFCPELVEDRYEDWVLIQYELQRVWPGEQT